MVHVCNSYITSLRDILIYDLQARLPRVHHRGLVNHYNIIHSDYLIALYHVRHLVMESYVIAECISVRLGMRVQFS